MSVVSQRAVTTERQEYIVPSPGCWTDVLMAINMALRDYNDFHGKPAGSEPYDNAIEVQSRDDEIIVCWAHEVNNAR